MKISHWARENFCSYRNIYLFFNEDVVVEADETLIFNLNVFSDKFGLFFVIRY